MIDKYDALQEQLGIDIRELNEYKFAQRQKNEVVMNKKYKDAEIVVDHKLIIKNKLKALGWGASFIAGFINCMNVYKVKVRDKGKEYLLTMEKTGRLIHVYEDQTKEIK
jgi:hypothetical protein